MNGFHEFMLTKTPLKTAKNVKHTLDLYVDRRRLRKKSVNLVEVTLRASLPKCRYHLFLELEKTDNSPLGYATRWQDREQNATVEIFLRDTKGEELAEVNRNAMATSTLAQKNGLCNHPKIIIQIRKV